MGFAAVAQSAGSETRACAELNLLKTENRKRIGTESTLSSSRSAELDGRAKEADDVKKKTVDTFYQVKGAELAKKAAEIGATAAWVAGIGAIAGALGNVSSSTGGGWGAVLSTGISSFFSILGAELAKSGAKDEFEMLNQRFDKLSDEAQADKNMVAAIDGNPVG